MILADFAARLLTLGALGWCVFIGVALLADHLRRARAATTPERLAAVADPVRTQYMADLATYEAGFNEDSWGHLRREDIEDVRHDNGLRVIRGDVA